MAHEIVVGVTGGIAAYKTAAMVSELVQAGVGVTVVMTSAARKFVGPATFAALTGRHVATRMFDRHYPLGAHIELARQAQLVCIAPASADFLAKAAQGAADDLLSTLLLSCKCPVVMCPAMNSQMWLHPAVQRNVEQLRQDGVELIDPQEGWLSCRDHGAGRMADPAGIVKLLQERLASLPSTS